MPIYLFESESGEVKEVIQGMNEPHVYSENGLQWKRIFTIPNAAINSNGDPFSERQFLEKTNKPGTLGDLMDRSRECSEKRAQKLGEDPMKKKFFDNYSKQRKGRKHLDQIKGI